MTKTDSPVVPKTLSTKPATKRNGFAEIRASIESIARELQVESRATPDSFRGRRVHLSRGDVASLRRDPGSAMAFYRLQEEYFRAPEDPKRIIAWEVLVQCMAVLAGLYDRSTRLGSALGRAAFSEGRLTRLLRAGSAELPDRVLEAARFLAAKGESQNMIGFAKLLGLFPARSSSQREIARDYFREIASKPDER